MWLDFYEGRASIEKVLATYDQHGFDANQDIPGNMLWEELYEASPKGTKVILTIRESDEIWWKSWCGFMLQGSLKIIAFNRLKVVRSQLIKIELKLVQGNEPLVDGKFLSFANFEFFAIQRSS